MTSAASTFTSDISLMMSAMRRPEWIEASSVEARGGMHIISVKMCCNSVVLPAAANVYDGLSWIMAVSEVFHVPPRKPERMVAGIGIFKG